MMKGMLERIRNNRTLIELMAGASFYCIIWEAALLIFTDRKLYHSAGLILGLVLCLALSVSIADSLEVAVSLDEKGAKAYIQKKASLRYLIVCAVIIALAISGIGNPLTCFAGLMGLKIGAYIQPFTHKIFSKFSKGDDTIDG